MVPTWRSGSGLDRLLGSIDAQSLDPARWDVLLVDDGSPPEDFARIQDVADRHLNTHLLRIEHSGWPSRPRNVGIDEATGDFILFADHDDELYPDSLRVALETLDRTQADVYAGKEARTDQPKWALTAFDRNVDDATTREDVHALAPTNPHKLYRTSMLRDHRIRFPEGGRQLWEDVIFNADVARVARGVSVGSQEPFYHWVRDGVTTSSSFARDDLEWWEALARVIDHVTRPSPDRGADPQRLLMLEIQFRERVLPAIGPGLLAREPEMRRAILERGAELVRDHWDERLEPGLPVHLLARVRLAQAGRLELLEELAGYDRDIAGIAFARKASIGDEVELHVTARWMSRHGGFLDLVVTRDGSVRRRLSPDLERVLEPELLVLDDDLARASVTIGLRSRSTKMTWLVPTESELEVSATPGYPDVTARSVARFRPDQVRLGEPMEPGYWDLNARTDLFGVVNQRAVRAVGTPSTSARRGLRVYANVHGNLSLRLG
ncbi:glycosyltransferase family 2 protein [Agromyces binzhouensis]|uniref:glycosyltransferase family 2 protein n=1 Tax=Agromyces binzhouensis TaxID=1817495 RepID=UPI003631D96D